VRAEALAQSMCQVCIEQTLTDGAAHDKHGYIRSPIGRPETCRVISSISSQTVQLKPARVSGASARHAHLNAFQTGAKASAICADMSLVCLWTTSANSKFSFAASTS
jgi:hypothetical protein